ncbi:MAG: SufD family Fe-S cluster assembly protein [Spirochaetia bacterium]|nr:SufD family Fe-S cluster assembly protein [Spirochaetia bacterium]
MDNTILKQNIQEKLIGINKVSSDKFKKSNWPVPMEEEWRRTNLAKYDMSGFQLSQQTQNVSSSKSDIMDNDGNSSLIINKTSNTKAVIKLNESGSENVIIFEPSNPIMLNDSDTVLVNNLAEDAAAHFDNKLSSLALSSFKDSVFIIIPDNLELVKPLVVEFESDSGAESYLPNLFIHVGINTQVGFIQKIKSSDGSSVSGVLNVTCGDNSNVHTATVTDIGSDSLIFINRFFNLSKNAFLSDFQSATGGKLIKTRTEVDLSGEKADARLYGVLFSTDHTQIDMRTVQHHKAKNCFSQATIKSVVKDKGRTIYQGLIEVEEEASLTDAYLTNHNLVLNNGARADSIPSLKIRNNDVKCSHGSTTSKINEEQILYLTSRGIADEEARQMILEGFLSSVYDLLPVHVKSYSELLIMDKIKQKEEIS